MKVVFKDNDSKLSKNKVYENKGIIKHNMKGYDHDVVVNIVINGWLVSSVTAKEVYELVFNDKDADNCYIEIYKRHTYDKPSKISVHNDSEIYITSSSLGSIIHVYDKIPKRGEGPLVPKYI